MGFWIFSNAPIVEGLTFVSLNIQKVREREGKERERDLSRSILYKIYHIASYNN